MQKIPKKTKQSAILINNFYNSIANGKSEKTENFCEKPLVENSFSEKKNILQIEKLNAKN